MHTNEAWPQLYLSWSQSLLLCWALQRVLQWFAALNVASAQSSSDRFLEDTASLQKVLRCTAA